MPTQEGQMSLDEMDGIDQAEIDEQTEILMGETELEGYDDED